MKKAPPRAARDESKLWNEFKRQSIQAAVVRLMCREGLDAVTMERVAQEVGIAKGTVYLHYHDKQELLDAVKESSLEPLMAKLDQVFESDVPPARKLEMFALRYLSYFDENRDLFRILLYEREVTRAQSSRYRGGRYRKLLEMLARTIDAAVADGTYRQVDSTKAAAMFIDGCMALVNHRLIDDQSAPVEDDALLISEIFVHGMCKARETKRESRKN